MIFLVLIQSMMIQLFKDYISIIGEFKNDAFLEGIIFKDSIRQKQLQAIEKSKDDLNKALLSSSQKEQDIG